MIIDEKYKEMRLIKQKIRIENHIKDLNKKDIFLLLKLLEKYYYLNKSQVFYFNFLITNIIKFNLFDYVIHIFEQKKLQ